MKNLLLSALFLICNIGLCQVEVSYNSSTINFINLGGPNQAFAHINSINTTQSVVTVKITQSFTEVDNPVALMCNDNVQQVRIFPTFSNAVISQTSPNSTIITINGESNVVIGVSGRTLTLSNVKPGSTAIKIINGSSNNLINYIYCLMGADSEAGISVGPSVPNCNNSGCQFNNINDNLVSRGKTGIKEESDDLLITRGNRFVGNRLFDQRKNGIQIIGSVDTYIEGNTIFDTGVIVPYSNELNGIFFKGKGNSPQILGNDVSRLDIGHEAGTDIIGIHVQEPSNGTCVLQVDNNQVALNEANPYTNKVHGISVENTIDYGMTSPIVRHNSVFVGGQSPATGATSQNSAFYCSSDPFTEIVCKNNIFVNKRYCISPSVDPGYAAYFQHQEITSQFVDFNNYYAPYAIQSPYNSTPRGPHVHVNGTMYEDIFEYRKAYWCNAFDIHSTAKRVLFESDNNNLRLRQVGGDLFGTPVLALDRLNSPRHAEYPYKGAYEINLNRTIIDVTASHELVGDLNTDMVLFLRNEISPYAIKANSFPYSYYNYTYKYVFGDSVVNGNYWLGTLICTHLETASSEARPISFPGASNYDFTTAASKAYGSNQVLWAGKWSFISGDVTGDRVIDLTDLIEIDNAAFYYLSGCRLCSDLNYDGIVDLSDLNNADNNVQLFVSSICPWY